MRMLESKVQPAQTSFAQLESKVNRRAFILVELLVTISIIGLLIAAAAFSLSSSRMNARDTARFADGITIGNALDAYAITNRGSYPMATDASCTDDYQTALGPYLPNAKAIPKDPRPAEPTNSTVNYKKCYTVYRNAPGPGSTFADQTKFSYLIEVGIEKIIVQAGVVTAAISDLSSYRTATELGVTAAVSSSRTPFYFQGRYCDTTCP